MNKQASKGFIFMFIIVIAGLITNGCSGSGHYSDERTLTLGFDTDKDGVPDIFDDYPDDANSQNFNTANENDSSTTHDSMETAIGKNSPFLAPSTFRGTIDAANSPDYFAVYLEGGQTYSLVFRDPEKMDGRAVTFDPDVTVYTGNVTILSCPEEAEPLSGVGDVISDAETIPLELSLVSDARIVILSFTAVENRIHYIAVRNASTNVQGISYQYAFDLIEDYNKNGTGILFKAADGSDYTYTYEDILLLKSTLTPYVKESANDGYPKTFAEGAEEAFEEASVYLARVGAKTPCSEKTSLDPYVSDIPWNSDYGFGYGIDASTGLPANQLVAVASFTPPPPTNESTATKTDLYFIKTDQEYERELQTGFTTSFSSFGVTFKASGSYGEHIKYSQTETTLILKYYLKETEYRKFDPAGGNYVLTDNAKTYLKDHVNDFRERYGDYFIAGARYGAQYVATLHIKASSAEEIRTVETKLSQASSTYKFDATEEFKAKFRNATQNCSVDVHRSTIGGDSTVLSAGTTVDQMFDDLKTFIKSCTKDNRAPLEAYMFRFNQIPDGSTIPTEINVNSCVFSATRDLSRNYLALSSRAKVIADLDANKFRAGVQDNCAQEFQTLLDEIRDNRQAICRDLNQIASYGARVKALKDKFSDLIDRFSFYQKLVAERSHWPSHTAGQNRKGGFDGYNLSVTVNNDITKAPWNDKYSKGYKIGWRNWYPSWKPGTDYRVCFIKIESYSKSDDWWDSHHPSLGNDYLAFHFKSGYDRGGSWQIWAKGVYLGKNQVNYPFMW